MVKHSLGHAKNQGVPWLEIFDEETLRRFEFYSYRNAALLLASSYPDQLNDIVRMLNEFRPTQTMMRLPGGNKSEVTKSFERSKGAKWRELRIAGDLKVRLLDARKKTDPDVVREFTRHGYLDGHRIDFVDGRVAMDFEWNSKDQTYDRDLVAFSAFYDAGAIDVAVIVTRGLSMDNDYIKSLGKALLKDGGESDKTVFEKQGASTTGMKKLLYRLDAGRNGGCPVLVIGIKPEAIAAE